VLRPGSPLSLIFCPVWLNGITDRYTIITRSRWPRVRFQLVVWLQDRITLAADKGYSQRYRERLGSALGVRTAVATGGYK